MNCSLLHSPFFLKCLYWPKEPVQRTIGKIINQSDRTFPEASQQTASLPSWRKSQDRSRPTSNARRRGMRFLSRAAALLLSRRTPRVHLGVNRETKLAGKSELDEQTPESLLRGCEHQRHVSSQTRQGGWTERADKQTHQTALGQTHATRNVWPYCSCVSFWPPADM